MRRVILNVTLLGVMMLLVWIAPIFVALIETHAARLESLGIPKKDSFGSPIDVGLLILGHSTSAVGDYPAKLAQALNANATDGRNYVVFRVITNGDGGFLWTQLSFQPNDPQYDRVRASQSQQQCCQDNVGGRWSCRRARLEEGLTGVKPPSCFNDTSCSPPATISLTWHEGGLEQTGALSFHEAWKKMDVRLALIQDTSNRSWPVDDFNGDGAVDEKDYWPESSITAAARPCGGTSGVVTGSGGARFIDWNCDGQLTAADAAVNRYADWMEKLALDLLNNFPPESRVYHVFITQKPLELICNPQFFPGEQCRNHLLARTPTASRPDDHFYLPTVYWEYRMIETLFARGNLDPRYHIYLKIAYHLSQEARAGLSEFRIPRNFGNRLFDFQTAAVKIAAHHLKKRNGVVIGDVVGLGKTLMATALAKIVEEQTGGSTLIICPKNLTKMWQT